MFPQAIGRQVMRAPQNMIGPILLNGNTRHRGGPSSSGNGGGANVSHGAVMGTVGAVGAAMNEFSSYQQQPTPHHLSSSLNFENIGMAPAPEPVLDSQPLTVSASFSLSYEQNQAMFGEELREAASRAPQFGFETGGHIANMQQWQLEWCRQYWPNVDRVYRKALKMYRNTKPRDSVEEFARWLSQYNDFDKFRMGGMFVCTLCYDHHVSRTDLQCHLWNHAAHLTPEQIECTCSFIEGIDHAQFVQLVQQQLNRHVANGQVDFQMDEAAFVAPAEISDWPGFGSNVDSVWNQAESDADGFWEKSPPPPQKKDDAMDVDDDEAADGQVWMLPEAANPLPQQSVAKHFRNYGDGSSASGGMEIDGKNQPKSASGLEILQSFSSERNDSPMGSLSPNSSSSSLLDASLSIQVLVNEYDQLYLRSIDLQQYWAMQASLDLVSKQLGLLVCAMFRKTLLHYGNTCQANMSGDLTEAERMKRLRQVRRKLRRNLYSMKFFNPSEAAEIIRNEFHLPAQFESFVKELAELTWKFVLCKPSIWVVAPPEEGPYEWPPLQHERGSRVHPGYRLGQFAMQH